MGPSGKEHRRGERQKGGGCEEERRGGASLALLHGELKSGWWGDGFGGRPQG